MKMYRVVLLFANYRFKSVYVRSDSKISAAIKARDEWNESHTSKARAWAVENA